MFKGILVCVMNKRYFGQEKLWSVFGSAKFGSYSGHQPSWSRFFIFGMQFLEKYLKLDYEFLYFFQCYKFHSITYHEGTQGVYRRSYTISLTSARLFFEHENLHIKQCLSMCLEGGIIQPYKFGISCGISKQSFGLYTTGANSMPYFQQHFTIIRNVALGLTQTPQFCLYDSYVFFEFMPLEKGLYYSEQF